MRMYLTLDAPINPDPSLNTYETHPIYEFDMAAALTDGIVSWSTYGNDRPVYNPNDGDSVWYDDFIATSATLNRYLSTNIPHQPYMEGDIFEASMSPYVQEDGIWVPNPSYYTMDAIPVGQRPPDWGIASNIFIQTYPAAFTYNNVEYRYQCWSNVKRNTTYDSSALYYRDTERKMIKMFYTQKGYSFTLYRGGGRTGNSTYFPFRYTTGGDCFGSDTSIEGYCFTNSSNAKLRKYNSGSSGVRSDINGNTYNAAGDESKAKILTGDYPDLGAKCAIFIHFTHDDKDFYGIGELNYDSYSEQAVPASIRVMAFTTDFWGDSIIAGGGGESVWGNDGPPAVPQGGNGSWSAPSDNRGDENGNGVLNISSDWGGYENTYLNASYNRYHLLTRGAIDSSLAFQEMCAGLWNPTFWQGFQNILLSPLDCIITCNMMPHNLCPSIAEVPTMKVIEAGGAELSTHTVPVFTNFIHHYHVGSISVSDISDSFADYTYSSIYIHLPYVGTYKIDTEAVMQGKLAVDYSVDMLTGDVTAFVWTEDFQENHTYRYTFKGNAAKRIPLNQRVPLSTAIAKAATPVVLAGIGAAAGGFVGSVVGGAVGLGDYAKGYAGAGGPGFPLSGALKSAGEYMPQYLKSGAIKGAQTGIGAARSASAALNAGQSVTSANVDGGTVTSPIDSQCYLIIERPIWSAPENYRKLFGYPSDISGTITDNFHGFLSCRAIKLDRITAATDDEKAEIFQLMASGVYVDDNFGPENE